MYIYVCVLLYDIMLYCYAILYSIKLYCIMFYYFLYILCCVYDGLSRDGYLSIYIYYYICIMNNIIYIYIDNSLYR